MRRGLHNQRRPHRSLRFKSPFKCPHTSHVPICFCRCTSNPLAQVDMDQLEAEGRAAFEGADSVFCCLGTTRPVGVPCRGTSCGCPLASHANRRHDGCMLSTRLVRLAHSPYAVDAVGGLLPRLCCALWFCCCCIPSSILAAASPRLRLKATPLPRSSTTPQTAGSAEAFRKVDLHYVEAAARAAAACK